MKDIYILGSGGMAKEVFFLLTEINKDFQLYHFKGFVDLNPSQTSLEIGPMAFPVYEESSFIRQYENTGVCLAIGIGNPAILQNLVHKYSGSFEFPNLIHPHIICHKESLQLGKGNIITFNCVLTVDIKLGSFNIINFSTTIGHDAHIGSFNVINPSVNVSGGVRIGDANLIGVNATILQYLRIGSNSILGGSSLLTKDLASNSLAVGIPAKVIKEFVN